MGPSLATANIKKGELNTENACCFEREYRHACGSLTNERTFYTRILETSWWLSKPKQIVMIILAYTIKYLCSFKLKAQISFSLVIA